MLTAISIHEIAGFFLPLPLDRNQTDSCDMQNPGSYWRGKHFSLLRRGALKNLDTLGGLADFYSATRTAQKQNGGPWRTRTSDPL